MVFLQVVLYVAIGVFIVANVTRFIRIATMPVHLRWELYPVPHESSERAKYGGSYLEETDWWTKAMHTSKFRELKAMLPEVLLLKGVWEHNRGLWLWSWLMHWGLYLLVGAVGLTLVGVIVELLGGGVSNLFHGITAALCWVAFVLGIAGTLGVLIMRLTSRKLRGFVSFATIFNLLLIMAVFILGLVSLARIATAVDQTFEVTKGVISFSAIPPVDGLVAAYLLVLGFFLLYFPFTHMTHAYTKYFTWDKIRWDDSPLVKSDKIGDKIDRELHYPVSWSAPHIKGDGRKTWVDVATSRGVEDE